jgi:SAM-dependent methyltransferase
VIGTSLRRALFGVGPRAACRAVLRRARGRWSTRTAEPAPAPDAFDLAHGTDTAGFRGWRELRGGGASDPYNSGYLPVDPATGRNLLSRVAAPEAYTFVDLGCGKGRALVLASEMGFRRVVGVEIDPALAEAARRNAAALRARFPGRVPIEVLHADAAAFRFPPEPLVVFLNHPFWGPVMRRVAARLAASLAEVPREAVVVYLNPVQPGIFDAVPLLERVRAGEGVAECIVWRTRAPRPVVRPTPAP